MNLNKKVAGVKLKWLAIAAPVVIVGALYIRSRSSSTASAPLTSPDPSIDPTTGQPYASEYGGGGVSTGTGGDPSGGSTSEGTPGTTFSLDPASQSELDYLYSLATAGPQGSVGAATPQGVDQAPAAGSGGVSTLIPASPAKKAPAVAAPAKKASTPTGVTAEGNQAKRLAALVGRTIKPKAKAPVKPAKKPAAKKPPIRPAASTGRAQSVVMTASQNGAHEAAPATAKNATHAPTTHAKVPPPAKRPPVGIHHQ